MKSLNYNDYWCNQSDIGSFCWNIGPEYVRGVFTKFKIPFKSSSDCDIYINFLKYYPTDNEVHWMLQ